MHSPEVDGLAVLPELTDDALLICNLLPRRIRGREKISKVMRALESHFVAVSDVERINSSGHRIIESVAVLPSGDRVKMTVFGTRDEVGWISEVSLTLDDEAGRPELKKILKAAADA